jgi:hypothetical protein
MIVRPRCVSRLYSAGIKADVQGVQRYFDPQAGTDDTSKFLASADQSRICMNCKRPGHNSRECPHILVCFLTHSFFEGADKQCPTCGKEDDHERRDCPYNLICFRCGLAGHKIQVSFLNRSRELKLMCRIAVNPEPRVVHVRSAELAITPLS